MSLPRYSLLALRRKFGSSGSYHSCTAGGYDELPVTQCTVFQRPLPEACPSLLKRKVNPVTRCKSHPGTEVLLGTCPPFPFSVRACTHMHTHTRTCTHTCTHMLLSYSCRTPNLHLSLEGWCGGKNAGIY